MKEFTEYLNMVDFIEDMLDKGFSDTDNQLLTHYTSTIYNLLHAKLLIEDAEYRRLYLDNIHNLHRERHYNVFSAEYMITDYNKIPAKLRELAIGTMERYYEINNIDLRGLENIKSCIKYSLGLLSGLSGNLNLKHPIK